MNDLMKTTQWLQSIGYKESPVKVRSVIAHKEYLTENLIKGTRIVLSNGPDGIENTLIAFEFDEDHNLIAHKVIQ